MNSYLELVPISARKRSKRSRMTIVCIAISVFLITGIFCMADASVQGDRIRTINKHGDWHFSLKNVSEEKLFEIANSPEVEAFSRYDVVNYDLNDEYYINGKRTVICACDEDYTDIMKQFEADSFPQNDNEIILNSDMMTTMGVTKGDIVELSTPNGTKDMVISGFIDDNSLNVYDAAGAFVTVNSFYDLTNLKNNKSKMMGYYRLKSNYTAKRMINNITDKYNLSDNELGTNTLLLAAYGNSDDTYIMGIYYIAAFLIVFVIAAGVFMIAGSISSSVSERTAFYGMLRCIGAGKKQILKLVRLEALCWCKIAIPIGTVCGMAGAWGLTAVMRKVSSEFADMPIFHISYVGILAGVVSGLVTVFLAALAPAKRAAGVSPIAAVSGNDSGKGTHKQIKNLGDNVASKMGISFAFEEKKSLFLISGSFALCIIVLFIFVSGVQLIKEALPCLRPYSADIGIYTEGYEPTLTKEVAREAAKLKEVKNVYGRMYRQVAVSGRDDFDRIDLISYDNLQFDWAKEDCQSGDIDKARSLPGYLVSVFDTSNNLNTGDKLTIDGHEFEIAAVLSDSPFSSSDIPTIICSEENFEKLFGESNYSVIDIQMNDEYADADQSIIRNVFGDSVILSDRRQSNKETKGTYYAFTITVFSFIFLLALISVINIINSIAMSTQARMKQFGVMRAIGLDKELLLKMVMSQGFSYAILGIGMGLLLGLPIHKISYELLVTAHFGIPWKIPTVSMFTVLIVIILATVLAGILPVKRIEATSVTEVIGEL